MKRRQKRDTTKTGPAGGVPRSGPDEGPRDVAVLFVDLVDSSAFASVLGLREYAEFLHAFHRTCLRQCAYFFETYLGGKYRAGEHYSAHIAGDELLVIMHTEKSYNDVYQLACLAVMLKAAWLAAPLNLERIRHSTPAAELSAGLHHGPVWARWNGSGYAYNGYALNLTKRIEGLSRQGERYGILLSEPAFKQVHFRLRNLIFGPPLRFEAKGILGKVVVHELAYTFLNPEKRLDPAFVEAVLPVVREIVTLSSQGSWVHDLYQAWNHGRHGGVAPEARALCERILRHSPDNPVALYHLAEAFRDEGDSATARVLLERLVSCWPQFGDGHLELGRLLTEEGNAAAARDCLLKAKLLGVDDAEELLAKSAAKREAGRKPGGGKRKRRSR